jgi:regulator of sirC expression with transglutaminase-like and TPR domain
VARAVDESEARARFAELMARPEPEIELDRVALTIAAGEYPALQTELYLDQLDKLSAELRPRISPEEPPERLVAQLNRFLFGEQAFHANAGNYYDPRNSYLNDVLDRRTGIPITLSLVYIEVARRVNLSIEGVGMPGHFLVRWRRPGDQLLIDPFTQGAILTIDDCAARLRELYGDSLRFSPELLKPARPREIVSRMLANLKGAYLRRGDVERALRAVSWGLVCNPEHHESVRESALLRFRTGDFRGAIADLERFLDLQPTGKLADQTRAQLRQIEQIWVRRN